MNQHLVYSVRIYLFSLFYQCTTAPRVLRQIRSFLPATVSFTDRCRGRRTCRPPSSPSRRWSETPGRTRSRRTPRGRRARSCWASPGPSPSGCTPAAGCAWAARWRDACSASWAGWCPSTARRGGIFTDRHRYSRHKACFQWKKPLSDRDFTPTVFVSHTSDCFLICSTIKKTYKKKETTLSIPLNSPAGECCRWPCCTCHKASAYSQSCGRKNKTQNQCPASRAAGIPVYTTEARLTVDSIDHIESCRFDLAPEKQRTSICVSHERDEASIQKSISGDTVHKWNVDDCKVKKWDARWNTN